MPATEEKTFNFAFDDVQEEAVAQAKGLDSALAEQVDDSAIAHARNNPMLGRAMAQVSQAVTRAEDALRKYGVIDAEESRIIDELLDAGNRHLAPLAIALCAGLAVLKKTREAMQVAHSESKPEDDKRVVEPGEPEKILLAVDDPNRDTDALRSGTFEPEPTPTAPVNPPEPSEVAEPGKPEKQAGPLLPPSGPEPHATPTPEWPAVETHAQPQRRATPESEAHPHTDKGKRK